MPGYLIAQSDARTIPLPDKSVHMCVTSPPYFSLRDYGTGRWEGGDDPACDHVQARGAGISGLRLDGRKHIGIYDNEKAAQQVSAPYRSQCRKCGARRIDRQIGLEDSIEAYVDVMVRVFREVKRVLRDDGTLYLNMGDSYASSGTTDTTGLQRLRQYEGASFHQRQKAANATLGRALTPPGLAPKNLLGMPWRVAFALQADGWTLRADIIWAKPNPMPESVTDRPTKSHEYLFLLSKQSTYFFDAEAVREPNTPETQAHFDRYVPREVQITDRTKALRATGFGNTRPGGGSRAEVTSLLNPAGRNLRSVWTLPTESWPGAHFATFPRKLVEPCVKAGSSERGCCPRCGAGWTRAVENATLGIGYTDHEGDSTEGLSQYAPQTRKMNGRVLARFRAENPITTLGWSPSCQCPPHAPVPAIILDPFAGSGTTLVVANALGRRAIGLDLSREYLTNQAQRRLERPHAAPRRPARVEPAMPLFGDLDP